MKKILITGGAGFFGGLCKAEALKRGYAVVSVDLVKDDVLHPNLIAVQGDIRNRSLLDTLCAEHQFHGVFHFAAILAHAVKDTNFLWTSNVDGTRNIADVARQFHIPKVIFTSSNCLWAHNFHRPVCEDDIPHPIEIYGVSKWAGEKILLEHQEGANITIIRCPTIIDSGRLGLLAILFEFIDENRKVWTVGGGRNVYQFIYAQDLANACLLALENPQKSSGVLNIGSDNVKSFREVYEYVIREAGSKSRVATLPRTPAIAAMKLAYFFKVSPLGPYQYKMIAEDFIFDTQKIKRCLGWQPTLTNEQMLLKSYRYYHDNAAEIKQRKDVSAHKQIADMGIIRLLKWLS
jgi:UDP-glucose 4-epimerase